MAPVIGHIDRWAGPFIDGLLNEEAAILLEGPRGSGKSTLLRAIAQRRDAMVLDLDDDAVLRFVREDVGAAVASPGLVAIDEFHRAPEVLSYVKRVVDREGGPGKFLLTASVSSFLLPPGTETLTGRAHRLSLMPLAAAEIFGATNRWLADLLDAGEPANFRTTVERNEVFEVVATGGYPAALRRPTSQQRTRWFSSYLATVTDRDLPDLVDVRRSGALSRLYRLVAQRTSSTALNTAFARALGVSQPTVASYRRLLERLYLTTELPGWTVGVSAKVGHRSKLHVTDTGLAAGVLSLSARRLATTAIGGGFIESFVLDELMRQATTIDEALLFAHFRDRSGIEVDIIVERPDGRVIAIEVKSARSVNQRDASGVAFLRERLGGRFECGIVFHTGPLTARLSERVWAVPVAALWGGVSGAKDSSEEGRS
ncbi:MAG: ATP-binding protein [Actinobacteria bacterium]|nr:ATP-binding protein [Actinomycetota bacterium]